MRRRVRVFQKQMREMNCSARKGERLLGGGWVQVRSVKKQTRRRKVRKTRHLSFVLDRSDRDLLDRLVRSSGRKRAEVVRWAIALLRSQKRRRAKEQILGKEFVFVVTEEDGQFIDGISLLSGMSRGELLRVALRLLDAYSRGTEARLAWIINEGTAGEVA